MTRIIIVLYVASALAFVAAFVRVWWEDREDEAQRRERALRELE
jgi:hypothetical protein